MNMDQIFRKWNPTNISKFIVFKISVLILLITDSESAKSPFLTNPFQRKNETKWELSVSSVNSVRYDACTYGEFSRANQRCESLFFKRFITKPQDSCAALFTDLQDCETREWRICFPNATLKSRKGGVNIDMINSMMMYSQAGYCNDGTLSLPSAREPINYCTSDYRVRAAKCIRKFHKLFRQNPGNPGICEEFSKARDCMYRLQDSKCQYEELINAVQKTVRKLYRCWNPFCIWNQYQNDFTEPRNEFGEKQQSTSPNNRGIPSDCVFNTAALITGMPVSRKFKDPQDGTITATTPKYKNVKTTTNNIIKDFAPPVFLTNKTNDTGGFKHFRPFQLGQMIIIGFLSFLFQS